MFKQSLLAASACFIAANAHLFISSPKPLPGNAIKDPLKDDGSNFPCHGVALPGSGGQSMAVGAEQKLAFDLEMPKTQSSGVYQGGPNTAVHGGGSCQLSITYETDPEKVKQASAWKVIYSIEGGCPTNSLMNLDGTYQGPLGPYKNAISCDDPHANGIDCVNSFNYTIPEGVKNGQATLAWTWFNNVGNREIYMNCAAVDISGGSDNSDMSDFPELFLANLGPAYGSGLTDAYHNVKFPNPGKFVTTKLADTSYTTPSSTYSIAVPSTLSGAGSAGSAPASYSASSYGGAPSSYLSTSSAYAAVPTSAVTTTMRSTTMATVATVTGTAPMAAGTGYAGSSSSSSNSTSGTCSDGKVSCPIPGDLVCIDDTHFGICNIDFCAVPQPYAPGTGCSNYTNGKRDVVRRRSSRIHRHIPGHIHHKY